MPSQQCSHSRSQKSSSARRRRRCSLAVHLGEVGPQRGQPLAVALLEPHDRAVELTLGQPLRALDPGAPGQLVEPGQRVEVGEPGHAAHAPRRRAARPDAGRVEGEGAEEDVDVVGDARLVGSGCTLVGGHHLGAGGPQDGVFLLAQPDGHRANVACARPQLLTLLSG